MAYACYLVNRLPSSAIGKTPLEVWSGTAADYDLLRVFGCPAYYHVKEDKLEQEQRRACSSASRRESKDSTSGNLRTGSLFSAEMSHLMRLRC